MKHRVWVVSELYYPETTSTAHYMTRIAEALAERFSVTAMCAQPTYMHRGSVAPKHERLNGVEIIRVASTTFDKNRLLGRLLNLLTISVSLCLASLWRIRRGDIALVVSNPPLLPFLMQVVCVVKGALCVVRVDDIYSELMVASGLVRRDSLRYRLMTACSGWLFRHARCVIVLGRDMRCLVEQRSHSNGGNICVISNWSDCEEVRALGRKNGPFLDALGLSERFIVQCAGNLGRVQEIEGLVEAAKLLKEEKRVHFLFIGSGCKKAWLEEQQRVLPNITVLGPCPREEQTVFLNACDIGTTALRSGMYGAAVPSRLYNIMAAGKPVLVIGDEQSEAGLVVREERIGWIVSPDDPKRIADVILEASKSPAQLEEFGRRARTVAERKYSQSKILEAYIALFSELASMKAN